MNERDQTSKEVLSEYEKRSIKEDLLGLNNIFDSLKTIQMGLKPLRTEVQVRIDEDSHHLTIVASLYKGMNQACLRLDLGRIKNGVPIDHVITKLRKSLGNVRGSGRTTRIIQSAPPNSILIVANEHAVVHTKDLLYKNHRLHDMNVKSLSWLRGNRLRGLRGLPLTTIVLDHDLDLSMDDLCILDNIRSLRHYVISENYWKG